MKLKVIIIAILACSILTQASLIISEGESFTWNFYSEDFIFDRVDPEPLPHFYQPWAISIDSISSDEIFSISMYENSLSDIPFYQNITTNTGSGGYAFATLYNTANMKWSDKQGIIKVDAIRGSVGFYGASANIIVGGEYFTASIPEPSSIALLFTGVGIFYLRKRKFSNQKLELTVKTPDTHAEFMSTEAHF